MSTINKPNSRNGASYQSVLSMILRGQIGRDDHRRAAADTGVRRFENTPAAGAGAARREGFLYRQAGKLVVKAVTPRDMMENLHLRRILEGEAVLLATPRIRDEDVARLRTALAGLESPTSQSVDEHWEVDDLVHRTIAAASGNGLLCHTVSDLRRRTRPVSLALTSERFLSVSGRAPGHRRCDRAARRETGAQRHAQHLDNARDNIIRKLREM